MARREVGRRRKTCEAVEKAGFRDKTNLGGIKTPVVGLSKNGFNTTVDGLTTNEQLPSVEPVVLQLSLLTSRVAR